LIRRV